MDSEMERHFEEGRTKRMYKQGEGSNSPSMTSDQVTHILTTITMETTASEENLKQHSTEYFQELKNQLEFFTNTILEKVPEANVLLRVVELSTRKRVRIVQIPPRELETSNEEVDATMQNFHTISFNVNKFPTHTLVQLQNIVSQELANREAIIGDHLVKLQEQDALAKE